MPRGSFDRSARRAQTRERLLAAAASVYARRGFTGATLDEVAGEAGFTKGAVYDHFGSKENLLVALWEEYVAAELLEQVALFDRDRRGWERPLAGSARWVRRIDENPDSFRLFVELWVYAQRDDALRARLAAALRGMLDTFAEFAAAGAADAGVEDPGRVPAHLAGVMVALGIGVPLLRLVDRDMIDGSLLGAALAVLARGAELDEHSRRLLEDPASTDSRLRR
jgi:AcrR family transcriptional regulator